MVASASKNKPGHAPDKTVPGRARPGFVRVIGGRWRGTKLPVADAPGLRPSGDRVRETLFNWLLPALPGARVLDVFAGSGALGFEAVSRGAACAVLVEREPRLVANLRATAEKLRAGDSVQIVQADALAWLPQQADGGFDIAFVDPPFAQDLWASTLAALLPKLAPGAWLYVEAPAGVDAPLPAGWTLHREGRTREVHYALYRAVAARV